MKKFLLMLMLIQVPAWLSAQADYQPSPENLVNRTWFQDAKFGMFIHWGVYSILGDGEWVMQVQGIDKSTYQKLPAFFNPIAYNPLEWVALAKAAGMKYIVITSKHHDGFAMFDSKLTDWDIADRTPYKKDVLKMLADECHKEGIKLFFYYSQLDWYQEDYYPRGSTGHTAGRPEKGNWDAYIGYMNGQLTELLTHYGQIGGIWFDGWWDNKNADWQLDKTYKLIHSLQPGCMIGGNHHQAPKPGEDFQMFEKDLPGFNTTGFSGESSIGELPLETCETMNNSWGFNLQDKKYKSSSDLIRYLVKAAGYNSNFLLNVGPMPDGRIQPEFMDTLKVIGKWMKEFGETIYGTRQGPVSPKNWGVTTQKDDRIFIHVLKPEDPMLFIPKLTKKVASVIVYRNRQNVVFIENKLGTLIELPDTGGQIDLVLEMKLAVK